MSTKTTKKHIVFYSCPQVTSLLRLLSTRRPALLNNAPLFPNNPALLRNNPPLLRDKRALPMPNKKEAYPMISPPLYNVLQITTPSDSPFDPALGKS